MTGTNTDTYWVAKLCDGASTTVSLTEAVDRCLVQLFEKRRFLLEVRSDGGSAELFIGWFLDGPSGDTFDYKQLAHASDLGIDLGFNIYSAH